MFVTKSPFVFRRAQKNETDVKTKYAQNPRSMQQSEYLSAFFVCRKPTTECSNECPGPAKPRLPAGGCIGGDSFRNGSNASQTSQSSQESV